jgi:general L-amino acid transport system permease protein
MVFRFPRQQDWRLWLLLAWLAVLLAVSPFVYRRAVFRRSPLRRGLTLLWLLTPLLSLLLLVGVGEEGSLLTRLNPDIAWGGLLLTVIIAVFGILASFPLGLMLSLGRRSKIHGVPVPAWCDVARSLLLLTVYLIVTRSPCLAMQRGDDDRPGPAGHVALAPVAGAGWSCSSLFLHLLRR